MAGWIAVSRADEFAAGQVKVVQAGARRVAVCNVDGAFYAIDDICTHDGGSLDQGELDGVEIECPRHGARFDVTSGRATCMPAVVPVKTYPVRIEGGEVQIDVP